MSSKRAPMAPPAIPGFDFVELLGSGGYADVYRYQQQMPKRQVAIKVLTSDDLGAERLAKFTAEANTMAGLSDHPFIVSVFHADVAGDGRPYIIMELYPKPNFSVRARTEQFSVPEVLRTGIQVASAVETAHRAGVLHRDIKPANILTSAYGRPGLTDFGIASSLAEGLREELEGMSIPWSPVEVITGTAPVDSRSDVYSLAATLYTLLVGRSPFEVKGGPNRAVDLIDRIERADLPPTGRGDVPPTLERLLRQAMAVDPNSRPSTAAEFAHALQAIELELSLNMTPFEVSDDGSADPVMHQVDVEAGATRLRGPTTIVSQPVDSGGERGMLTPSARTSGPARSVGPVPVDELSYGAVVRRSAVDPVPMIASGPGVHRSVEETVRGDLSAFSRDDGPTVADGGTSTDARPSTVEVWAAGASSPTAMERPSAFRAVVPYVAGVAGALTVIAVAVLVVSGILSEDAERPIASENPPGEPEEVADPRPESVEPVSNLQLSEVEGDDPSMVSYEATWEAPDEGPADRYNVTVKIGTEYSEPETTTEHRFALSAPVGTTACVIVSVSRGSALSETEDECSS
jgi:serine/threonine protein kinase